MPLPIAVIVYTYIRHRLPPFFLLPSHSTLRLLLLVTDMFATIYALTVTLLMPRSDAIVAAAMMLPAATFDALRFDAPLRHTMIAIYVAMLMSAIFSLMLCHADAARCRYAAYAAKKRCCCLRC